MTYRERRERRAERLRGWAEKREQAAVAVFKAGELYTSDIAFNTQPGSFPFRKRLIAREDRAHESLRKAHRMESRADGIEDQLDRSIYSDDPDAIQALEKRISELEAKRDHMKRVNVAFRKGDAALAEATGRTLEQAAAMRADISGYSWQRQPYSFELKNLTADIARNKKRLDTLRGLIGCQQYGCGARFFLVPERAFPRLCLDHAAEKQRAAGNTAPEYAID
jgi:hypothetical protein